MIHQQRYVEMRPRHSRERRARLSSNKAADEPQNLAAIFVKFGC